MVHLIRFGAGVAVGAQVTGHLMSAQAIAGGVAWVLAVLAVYVFNGVMDVHEDRLNGSRRPIASGSLSRRTAAICVAGAAVAAMAAAAPEGIPVTCAVAAILLIGWQYSAAPGFLKRRMAGTAAGGAAMGFLAYFAGFAGQAGGAWTHPGPGPVIFAVTMSAWMAFVGAPAKDLPDVRGDADAGRRTVAVLWGEHATRRIIASSAIVIAIAFCVAASSNARLLAWPAATLGAGAVAAAVLSLSPLSEGSRSRRRLPYRAFMVTQYVTNACLLITVIRLATPLTSVLPQ